MTLNHYSRSGYAETEIKIRRIYIESKSKRLRNMHFGDLTEYEKEKCCKFCEQWNRIHSLPAESKLLVGKFLNLYIKNYEWNVLSPS